MSQENVEDAEPFNDQRGDSAAAMESLAEDAPSTR
jgi:hypothetical protein